MPTADIKLGYSCNNDCIHCVIADHRDLVLQKGLPEDISEETYRKELQDSRARADRVVFTGGEPTIRRELLDLIAFARDLGFVISMQTNGRRLSRMDFARALCGLAQVNFTIALHGPNSAVHDAITQREGSFYETVQGIRNVLEIVGNARSMGCKIVISKMNAPYIVDTVRFMLSLGIESVSLTFPHACGNARKDFFNVVPRYRDIQQQILNALEICFQEGASVQTEALPYCLIPGFEFCSTELTQQSDYTELKQYGCENIIDWNRVRVKIKEKGPACPLCRFDKVCEGPWNEYPQNYGFDELIPVPGEPVLHYRDLIQRKYFPPTKRSDTLPYSLDCCPA
jgi:MoaA/NifB/PqqE/SkfB family radical SAM enzyme